MPIVVHLQGASTVNISVIVPVFNGGAQLSKCLEALVASRKPDVEIIVVDDASTDHSSTLAAGMGVSVVHLARNSGPAAARNAGALVARGDILFFVDADVVVAPDAVGRVARIFADRPDVAAVFGSYDDHPAGAGLVSQYRNLLHHFVHQHSNVEASTFWAGCGAIRRSIFMDLSGFDAERFRYPSIEDIELGVRMRRAGFRVLLDKGLQGTHLKRWTLRSVVKTDITRRAIPWTRLILEMGSTPDDLNLKRSQRASAALVAFACVSTPLSLIQFEWAAAPGIALVGVVALNHELYRFFARQRGPSFAIACIPLHFLYYLYSTLSYAVVRIGIVPTADSRRGDQPVEARR
jgi:GT2 family glycosyltransferase